MVFKRRKPFSLSQRKARENGTGQRCGEGAHGAGQRCSPLPVPSASEVSKVTFQGAGGRWSTVRRRSEGLCRAAERAEQQRERNVQIAAE